VLYTKSILKEKIPEDGVRISVMNRHTLNDGATPDNRIIEDSFDERLQVLAPPSRLLGDYYKRGLTWEHYESRYFKHLRCPNVAEEVKRLASRAVRQDITLLCIEDSPEFCHRRLLAEECQKYESSLQVIHR
jgi:uncharacterized protein YeaO (DUF488 family)